MSAVPKIYSNFVDIMVSILLNWDMIKSQLVDGRR